MVDLTYLHSRRLQQSVEVLIDFGILVNRSSRKYQICRDSKNRGAITFLDIQSKTSLGYESISLARNILDGNAVKGNIMEMSPGWKRLKRELCRSHDGASLGEIGEFY